MLIGGFCYLYTDVTFRLACATLASVTQCNLSISFLYSEISLHPLQQLLWETETFRILTKLNNNLCTSVIIGFVHIHKSHKCSLWKSRNLCCLKTSAVFSPLCLCPTSLILLLLACCTGLCPISPRRLCDYGIGGVQAIQPTILESRNTHIVLALLALQLSMGFWMRCYFFCYRVPVSRRLSIQS